MVSIELLALFQHAGTTKDVPVVRIIRDVPEHEPTNMGWNVPAMLAALGPASSRNAAQSPIAIFFSGSIYFMSLLSDA